MKTIVYVDGFNFYYGALRNTPHKWIDLRALFTRVLLPTNQIVRIKYFTARVSAMPNDPDKADHQDAYLRALTHTTPALNIYYGQFTTHKVKAKLVTPLEGNQYAKIFKTSEKGSDVNLAVHLLNDAWIGAYDCAIVVSADSDLAQAICLVKTFHVQKKVGLLTFGKRPTSKDLIAEVDFIRRIKTSDLAASHFPDQIPGTPISKPPDW